MNRIAIAFAAACAAISLPSPALAIIISSSQNTATQGMSAGGFTSGVANIVFRDVDGDGTLFEPIDDQFCTGTMLKSDKGLKFILTAAHCLYVNGVRIPNANLEVNFPEDGIANVLYGVANSTPHPLHVPGAERTIGNDIAILELAVDLTGIVAGWDPNRGEIPDERAGAVGGLVGTKVGYGLSGDGTNGATGNPAGTPNAGDPDARQGTQRSGVNFVELFGPVSAAQNVVDTAAGSLLRAPKNTLIYDFDNHVAGGNGPLDPAVNAALGAGLAGQFSAAHAATGTTEVDTAPGDSGGPMFMFDFNTNKFVVVGVTSYGTDTGPPGSTFGDIAVDTRVRPFRSFVDSFIVPEPSTWALTVAGVICALGVVGRRKS